MSDELEKLRQRIEERRSRGIAPWPELEWTSRLAANKKARDPQFNIDRLRLRVKQLELEVEARRIDLQEAMYEAGQLGPATKSDDKDNTAALTPAPEPAEKREKETLEREEESAELAEFMSRPGAVKHDGTLQASHFHSSEMVETFRRDRKTERALMCTLIGWTHDEDEPSDLDIIAYRIIEAPAQASSTELRSVPGAEEVVRDQIEIPEGFLPWTGGHPANAGITFDMVVEIITRNGDRETKQAGMVHRFWWEEGMPEYDVIAYRVIEPAQSDDTPAEHTSDLTGDPAIEPETGLHGETVTTLGPPNLFLNSIIKRGGTWHDGGDNPAPDWFCDIYVPAGASSLGVMHELEGQPSNAYVWKGWEVAYVKTQPMYAPQPDTPALNDAMQDDREEGYQHVVAVDEPGSVGSYLEAIKQGEPLGADFEQVWADNRQTLHESEPVAPATDPDADAFARAHDYYSPENVAARKPGLMRKLFGHTKEPA